MCFVGIIENCIWRESMGYKEAKENNVRFEKQANGRTAYFPPCHICGVETFSQNYIIGRDYTCTKCKNRRKSYYTNRKGLARMRK